MYRPILKCIVFFILKWALSCHTRKRFMLTNLACPISRLTGGMGLIHYGTEIRLHHRQTGRHGTEGWKDASDDNKWMIVQCATFSKTLNPRNIDKSVSDIRILIRFPFESSFWISVSGCKLTILPDIQPANRIVITSAAQQRRALVWTWIGLDPVCDEFCWI